MTLKNILNRMNISQYKLSTLSGVPYTTINDICNEKTNLKNCSAETVYKIAKSLNITMEYLLEDFMEERCSFELFKSNVCHKLKELSDINFIIDVLESHDIRRYYEKNWYPESFYLLAMVDYLSRINNIPLCNDYDDLRCQKLKNSIYPAGIIALYSINNDENIKIQAYQTSIPEFKKYNIIERDIRDVI